MCVKSHQNVKPIDSFESVCGACFLLITDLILGCTVPPPMKEGRGGVGPSGGEILLAMYEK